MCVGVEEGRDMGRGGESGKVTYVCTLMRHSLAEIYLLIVSHT
jgi:hypothetical protein